MEERAAPAAVDGQLAGRADHCRCAPGRSFKPSGELLLAVVLLLAVTTVIQFGGGEATAGLMSDEAEGPVGHETLPVDVRVRVVNGTTREAGEVATVVLLERGDDAAPLATLSDVVGEAIFRGLYLDETRSYVVEVMAGGIAYQAATTGRELAEGPVTVYVFNTTTDRSAVQVGELTLILRRGEAELGLEYMITLQNTLSPQQTILPDPTSFELRLPEGAVAVVCEVISGLISSRQEPISTVDRDRLRLAVPLRSGATRLRVTANLPYPGKADLDLAASAPVQQLTLLTHPPDLEIRGGLSDQGIELESGYHRYNGPPLAADQVLSWTVTGGSPPRIATDERVVGNTEVARDKPTPTGDGGRLLRLWVGGIMILILVTGAILFIVRQRRRGADSGESR